MKNEREVLDKYEIFIQEKKAFLNGDLSNLYRSNAVNHKEKVASSDALRALSMANLNYDIAMEAIDELIKQNSKFAFLYLIKGKIQENSFHPNPYELAKKEFLIATDINNDFLEALIELGFLELKNRVGKNKTSKEMIIQAIKYFERALEIDENNNRSNHGIAQAYTAQSKDLSKHFYGTEKQNKARKANHHFNLAYYTIEPLTPTQIHSNAIISFTQSLNFKTNLRDYEKAYECCLRGLTFEPKNVKLLLLKEELEFKLDPKLYTSEKFKEKGWAK